MPPPDTDQATGFRAPTAPPETGGSGRVWPFPSDGATDAGGTAALGRGPSGPIELSMRPRPLLLALLCAGAAGAPVGLVWASYSAARFDGRIPFVALELLVVAFFALRARYVVADRTLWRRGVSSPRTARGVRLDRLASVEMGRARYLKNQGVMRTRLVVADDEGRQIALKPALWHRGARPLMALLDICARSQGLTLDDRTAEHLSTAGQAFGQDVPAWAYHGAARAGGPVGPESDGAAGSGGPAGSDGAGTPAAPSSFWTRRDADGRLKKAQWQRLPVVFAILAAAIPVVFFTAKVGTDAVRSARCASERHLWGPSAAVGATATSWVSLVEMMPSAATYAGAQVRIYQLDRQRMYNSNASAAMKAAAGAMVAGADIGWTANNQRTAVADVLVEQFPDPAAALAYQQQWGEEHCHQGDLAFTPPGIAGATGFRCGCRGGAVDDRVAFLRGPIRIQATFWRARSRDGHQYADALAQSADRLAGPPISGV
jgi:hypothetical protein